MLVIMHLYMLADFHNQNANKMEKKRTPDECIIQEILRLEIVTACLWDDYKTLIATGKPIVERQLVADEFCLNRSNLRCLQMRNFKNMTYDVKLLFDK